MLSFGEGPQSVALAEGRRGRIVLSTHLDRAMVSDEELRIVGMLAPHVRRALRIRDVMEAGDCAADTFERMLDTLQTGVTAASGRSRRSVRKT